MHVVPCDALLQGAAERRKPRVSGLYICDVLGGYSYSRPYQRAGANTAEGQYLKVWDLRADKALANKLIRYGYRHSLAGQ